MAKRKTKPKKQSAAGKKPISLPQIPQHYGEYVFIGRGENGKALFKGVGGIIESDYIEGMNETAKMEID